jgi:hypothetical protein
MSGKEVDVKWWNKIISLHSTSGSGATTYVNGWILDFLGIGRRNYEHYSLIENINIIGTDINKIETTIPNFFTFEIIHTNLETGIQNKLLAFAGFGGVHKNETGDSYRPTQSLSILLPDLEFYSYNSNPQSYDK